jgi:NADH-quinone oxidoreductase subunit L
VTHGNADETNIKRLGGLRREMPWTWATFLISTLAITGVVPLSGFFSKDAILHGDHTTRVAGYPWASELVWAMGLFAAFCTAFYMFRLYLLIFHVPRAKDAKTPHAHESSWPMTLPLVVLAALSVLGVAWGLPLVPYGDRHQTLMENFLVPVIRTAQRIEAPHVVHLETSPWGDWGLAWLIALTGFAVASLLYLRYFPAVAGKPAPLPVRILRTWVENKFYVDELYDWLIVKPVKLMSFLLYRLVDTLLIDTLAVRGVGWLTRISGSALRYLQTGDTQSYAAVMAIALVGGLVYALLQVFR